MSRRDGFLSFIKKQESRLSSCTGVAGEILAIRKELFQPPADNIINDDFNIALSIFRQGYNILYVPEAKSAEKPSQYAQDEIIRRKRIIAGRFQAMALAQEQLPWQRPLITWQIISHKFLRPLVPFFMISAAVSNLVSVLIPTKAASERTRKKSCNSLS